MSRRSGVAQVAATSLAYVASVASLVNALRQVEPTLAMQVRGRR